jgi:hypothetical protein
VVYESPYWLGWSAGAWGKSWGYDADGGLIEVEEYHGGGGRRQFSDASEDDILRMVQEKWEAIDRAREADHIGEATKKVDPSPSVTPDRSDAQDTDRSADAGKTIVEVPSIIAAHWSTPATNGDTLAEASPDVSLSKAKNDTRREEEALLLAILSGA